LSREKSIAMKKSKLALLGLAAGVILACNNAPQQEDTTTESSVTEEMPGPGQAAVKDNVSEPNIVNVAVGSPDHTTLVAAVQAAGLVDALANAGPFTVFAPSNAAFDKLPAGTVEELVKPENKTKLSNILLYHVTTTSYQVDALRDGLRLGMADGGWATISVKEDGTYINDAKIVGSVKASNGMIHVIDGVILPK
jgi:uncharacterized surface protein with fasciclin (FAS1) repeats